MIHFTVAAPLGIDSLFFSFVKRLAVQNGHNCIDPPAEQLDGEKPGHWMEMMRRSSNHHFLIGYRYPPRYWPQIVEQAKTVVVLADGDGIVKQVEHIQKQNLDKDGRKETGQYLQEIRDAVDTMVDITELLLQDPCSTRLLTPAVSFQINAHESFRRLERFYQVSGVPISKSCWQGFSTEAKPLLDQIQPASMDVRILTLKLVSLEEATPTRLKALETLFGLEA